MSPVRETTPSSARGAEDKVFALPGMEKLAPPPMVRDFYAKLAPKITIPSTTRAILNAFASADVKAEKVASALRVNPYYLFHFMKQIAALSKREDLPSVEGAVVLLGMQRSRDLIVAMQLLRTVTAKHPEWDASGKLKIAPDQILKYALATEETLAPFKKTFTDTAYAAALAFDMLMLLSEGLAPDPTVQKRLVQFIDDTYKHAIKTAVIAGEIAKQLPEFAAKRYLFSACLLHDIGRVAMAILDSDYLNFAEQAAQIGISPVFMRSIEEARFGVGHPMMGALVLQSLQIFKPFERAVLYSQDPFLLKARNRNLYQLCAMVSLSGNIAAKFQVPKSADDPVIASWKGPDLADFKVDGRLLVEALGRVKS